MKKIYIWGTGALAETCASDLVDDVELLGFVESNPVKDNFMNKKLIPGNQLLEEMFDYVVLANGHEAEILNHFTIDADKVVYYRIICEADEQGKVLCFRKDSEKLEENLFNSQKKIEITEKAREVMPYISVETDGMAFVFNNKDILIPNIMIGYGKTFSKEEMEFVYNMSPKFDRGYFLDIGANVGTSSIYFCKKLNSSLKYICFEPLKENVKCLKANCILNECDDIIIENVGVSDKEQEHNMFVFDGAYGSSMVCSEDMATTKCRFVTLDKYIEEHGIAKDDIAYIWVDVQGHELEVVHGAIQTLKESPASLYMEFNISMCRSKGKVKEFLELLSGIYKKFIVYEQFEKGRKKVRDIEELYSIGEELDIDECNILFLK